MYFYKSLDIRFRKHLQRINSNKNHEKDENGEANCVNMSEEEEDDEVENEVISSCPISGNVLTG